MAGAVFGEVGVSLFVAGAALREIWIDSPSAIVYLRIILNIGNKSVECIITFTRPFSDSGG